MNATNPTMMAIDPETGCHIRKATHAESKAYYAQKCINPSFSKAVRVGDVLVDEWTGPGVWYGGAGF